MKLAITDVDQALLPGIREVAPRLKLTLDSGGVALSARQAPGALTVTLADGRAEIHYPTRAAFFRGLMLLSLEARGQETFHLSETPRFETDGAMIDVSRNTFPKVQCVKDMIRAMALMGLNMLMLYMEDAYEIEGEPYFGYMRGRYSPDELRAIDDYADLFGIEVVPCIQTLAHLREALQWDVYREVRDTDDILMIDEEKTYALIAKMIDAVSKPLRSKRIHLGMDEAHYVGLGKYLRKNGPCDRFELMTRHLTRVCEIARERGLSPMIWSDMYFRLASVDSEYRGTEHTLPARLFETPLPDVGLVYWDYYENDPAVYETMLAMHARFERPVLFAGAAWTWCGATPHYDKAITCSRAALAACKKAGVREVFVTAWQDDGDGFAVNALAAMQYYAEQGYADAVDEDAFAHRFWAVTGVSLAAFEDYGSLHRVPGLADVGVDPVNPANNLLWQDVLMGLLDRNTAALADALAERYARLAPRLHAHSAAYPEYAPLFDMAESICLVLAKKVTIGLRLKACYDQDDRAALQRMAEEDLSALSALVKTLRLRHRKVWFALNEPFGWEVLDIRYGGLLARIDTAISRIGAYLAGETDSIPELARERLFHNRVREDTDLSSVNDYSRIATAAYMWWQ